jgi:hypothetical protein
MVAVVGGGEDILLVVRTAVKGAKEVVHEGRSGGMGVLIGLIDRLTGQLID